MPLLNLIKQARSIEESDLPLDLLLDLTLKHFFDAGILDLAQLADRMALTGKLMEIILTLLRKDSLIEVLAINEYSAGVRYQLSCAGHIKAKDAFSRCGYIGRAPISINHYRQLVATQSVALNLMNKEQFDAVFTGIVIEDAILEQLGPALHSGRAILIYGEAGTGKTFISKQLIACLGAPVYLPYAISVGMEIIQFFDPLIHKPVYKVEERVNFQFETQTDHRLLLCKRPLAISGGELTMDRLEISYDRMRRLNQAPIQLKANNGIYIIDDLGRQRMPPIELFNRWIIPMEEHVDYLVLGSGQHFPVPFDMVLIFSTNLSPLELAEDAFLRRLGYKIKFSAISKSQYTRIWENVCHNEQITVENNILAEVFDLYAQTKRPFLSCQPRDLIKLALDIAGFNNQKSYLSKENIQLAWKTYFIS